MLRVALYARYSSDSQRAPSIEDQFRLCEERATREGWQVVDTYRDAAISRASTILRPSIQTLMRDAQAGQFDIVLAEALDRVSRDQADVATLFKRLHFAGVTIDTLAEGEITELHVGLKGTMNALFLKDLAMKTHRGLRGRVEAGKSGGRICYGYRVVHQMDARGELIRGEREIDPIQAGIVRRIFREFASGRSALSIAGRLNDEGIPSLTGGKWNNTTLRGNALRGTGIVNNELYVGRLFWNRLRYLKDPQTGKRVSRLNPQSEWVVTDVPELRIIDDDLWQAVRDRQVLIAEKSVNISAGIRASNNRLNGQRRPKSLLSGLAFAASRDQGAKNTNTPEARASGVSVSGIAGARISRIPPWVREAGHIRHAPAVARWAHAEAGLEEAFRRRGGGPDRRGRSGFRGRRAARCLPAGRCPVPGGGRPSAGPAPRRSRRRW